MDGKKELQADGVADAPVVFLVNHISGHGHLDMYARLYSRAFLQAGCRVALLSKGADQVADYIALEAPSLAPRFRGLTRADLDVAPEPKQVVVVAPTPEYAPLPQRMARIWRQEGAKGLLLRLYLNGRRAFDHGWYYTKAAASFLLRQLRRAASTIVTLRTRYPSFHNLVPDVQSAKKFTGWAPDLVFFLYLDMVDQGGRSCRAIAREPWLWSGILFHPQLASSGKPERYLECDNCAGLAFLNPALVGPYTARAPQCDFIVLPDVTEATLPAVPPAIVGALREKAGGRPIVLLSGSLSPHKGVMSFLDLVRTADADAFCFALIGEIFWHSFGSQEKELRDFVAAPPENCFTHPAYLPNDEDVNAVIASASILYSVYKDFPNSSNSLTKASIFKKPILVSEGGLMAERVNQYKLGAVVPFGAAAPALAALHYLTARADREFGFDDYGRDHSLEALASALRAALPSWASIAPNISTS